MAVSHKGAISFGLVHIPVALYTATQDNDIHFNQLHKEDHSRIRYKKTCAHCGKEISSADIVKGFEYDKDQYVVLTNEELEKIKTEKDKTLQILHFTDLSSIRPIYYDKTYHVVPEAGGEKAFALLRQTMRDENKVAIAKTVMGTKETLLAIMPTEEGLLIETLFFHDEIKDIPKEYSKPEVNEAELGIAKQLIAAMDKPFDPSLYHDEYQQRIKALIADKIAGKAIVAAKDEKPGNVIDLMDALKKSVEQAGKKPRTARARKTS
ncbi:MAG: Ku protein [Clostridiales bacterium]|nr:Ku protein [Clostridiales bacterium]